MPRFRKTCSTTITVFTRCFENYCEKTRTDCYKKIPYSEWKELKKITQINNGFVYINITYPYSVKIECKDISVYITDNDFVSYVYGYFFYTGVVEVEEPKEIIMSDGTIKTIDNVEKENDNMKNKYFNFDFGTCENDCVKMSVYGIAIRNVDGNYVAYNANTDEIIDVDILNFDCGKFLFKMPIAIDKIRAGMTIVHNRVPMFVKEVDEDGQVTAVDPRAGELKVIMPTKNMFGFNFVTQIVSLFDMNGVSFAETANEQNPFGNLLPFLLMDGSTGDNDMMIMALAMGGNFAGDTQINPMMLMMMANSNGNMDNMLPFLLMGNINNN